MLARWTGGELVRLQCYEGIDAAQAVYEWDYSRQLLHLRAVEASGARGRRGRAVLRALPRASGRCCARSTHDGGDRRRCCSSTRSTAPTTSSRRSCSRSSPTGRSRCPSSARSAPRCRRSWSSRRTAPATCTTRSKRRCLYHWIAHPDFERELAIVRLRAPEVPEALARRGRGRGRGAARARALQAAGRRGDDRLGAGARRARRARRSTSASVDATLGTILKYREDQERVRAHGLGELVRRGGGAQCLTSRPSAEPTGRGRVRPRPARRRARRAGRQRPSPSREALGARRRRHARAGVLGRPGDARAPPRGHRRSTTARSPRSGDGARRSSCAPRPPADRGRARVRRRRRRRRPTTTPTATRDDAPDARGAVQPGRGAAPPRLRARTRPAEFAEARRLMADLRLAGARAPLAAAAAESRARRGRPDLRRTVRARAAHRRRADPPRVRRAGRRGRAGSCCCST